MPKARHFIELLSANRDDWPPALQKQADAITSLARVHAAWDRLDYRHAQSLLEEEGDQFDWIPQGRWSRMKPNREARRWVNELAAQPPTTAV